MRELKIGLVYPDMIAQSEGVRFNIDESGSVLYLNYDLPTAGEIDDIQSGDLEYKLFYYREVAWLLFRFGSQPWIDAPYSIHLSSAGTDLPEIDEGLGLTCTIILINNRNGEIKSLRFISFDTKFSKALKECIEDQKEKEFSRSDYDANLNNTMMAYTTNQLVKMAKVRGKLTR